MILHLAKKGLSSLRKLRQLDLSKNLLMGLLKDIMHQEDQADEK